MLPPVVTGYLLLILLAPNGALGSLLESVGVRVAFSWWGAAVAAAVVSFPLMTRCIRSGIQSVDKRLELTSRSLGKSRLTILFTITFPLALNGIVAGCILAFARSVGEFGATIMLAGDIPGETRTIPLAIYSLGQRVEGLSDSWRLVLFSIVLSMAAVVIGEFIQHRQVQREAA